MRRLRQRRVERLAHVVGPAVAALAHAELRREEGVAAATLERLADEALALAAAVDVRRVDVRDAGVERRVDDLDAARAVEPASEVVRAEADTRKLDHCGSLPRSDASVSSSSGV